MFPAARLSLFCSVVTLFIRSVLASEGYILPSSGNASTTQFAIGPELAFGTSCGANGWAGGNYGNPSPGNGPGYLYAAINQLAFGANPSAPNGGGPGGACGVCYRITPISREGAQLTDQAMVFMIVDECPASINPGEGNYKQGSHCGMCKAGDVNNFGQQWHFDIASDAMNSEQYNTFFKGVTDGTNWRAVSFVETACCGETNPDPPMTSWGCMDDCPNNPNAPVCKDVRR